MLSWTRRSRPQWTPALVLQVLLLMVVILVRAEPGAAANSTEASVISSFLSDTNLYGQDYRSFDVSGQLLCRNACLEEVRCKAWTYVHPGIHGPPGKCWLKESVPTETADTCCISGVKKTISDDEETVSQVTAPNADGSTSTFLKDTILYGQDYRSVETSSPFQCRNACVEDERCRAWTFARLGNQGSGTCSLKDGVPSQTAHTCCVSGVKAAATAAETTKDAVDPHILIAGLEITFARERGPGHRSIDATKVFKDTDKSIFVIFRNPGSEPVRANVDIYELNIEGRETRTRPLKSFSVLVQPSKRASNRIGVAETGLDPGTYRFAISAANSHLNAEIEIERTGATPKLAKTENKTAATKEPEKPAVAGSSEQKPEPRFGYNIALGALGGRVERASQYGKDDGGWSKRHINDGLTWVRAPHDLNKCMICGWGSRDGDRRPSIVLSFHKNREAELAAVVVDTRYFRDPRNNYDQHTAWLPKDVAVHVSSVSPTSGFERVAIKRIYRNVDRQVIRLPRGTRAKFVKVEVLENYGAPAVVVGEIEVIEADSHETSILDDAEIDLANVALGGALVRFTSQVKDQLAAAYLFDGEDRGRKWISYDRYFPQDFTIAFKDDHLAFIDKVRLTLPREDKVSNVPSEVAIAVSRQNPLDGFIEIGRFPVERRAGPQDFPVGQEARFVKVRLLDNHGTQRTALAEIAVIEGRREGYTSVLLRDAPTSSTDAVERDEGERVAEDAVEEVEPNNDQGTAGELIMDQMVSGAIDPLGEVDFFALPEFGAEATAFTLRYSGRPYIRHGLSLLDSGGAKISHFNPGDLPARDARLTFALSGNEQYLKLSEPPASVVVIWDTSGSMQGSEADLERAVREYIRRAPENQGISLIRFSGDVEVLIHGFTSNKSRLQSSLNGKFWANGGTRLYDAVIKGMELLANEQGNRAIVVMTDGEDTGHTWHDHFWQKVEKNRIRLYTIGLGTGLKNYSYKIGTSGERVLRHLALATSGEAFFAAESQALQRFYARIADELSRPATYLLTPTVERGTGTLRLVATGDQVPSAAMPAVHLIYDLSGSMLERGPDGRPKYRTAQEAVFTAVDALPDGTLFGLTVYGARIPEKAGKQRACTDIVTLENLAPLNKKAVKDFIARHRPRGGTTPLAASIRHVAENFPNQNNGLIIAVTDGIEECDPSPVETVKGLKAGKMQYLELNVVGFALKDPEAQAMMKAISEVGGGQYFDASDGEALAQALKETMAAKYTVRDAADRVVGSGTIDGGDLSIPPGFYRVRIDAAGAPIQVREVRIDRDHVTTVRVNKVASDIDIVVSEPESLAAIREARQTCGAAAAELEDDRRAARIQAKLNKLRFDAGPADNRPGPRTRRAIAAFAKKYGLPEAMQVGLELEQHLDCVIAIGDTYLAAN